MRRADAVAELVDAQSQKPVLAREWKFDSFRPHYIFNPHFYNIYRKYNH